MKKIKLLLWSAVVATLSACSSSSPEALEGSWQLTHIDGKPAATGAVLQLNLKDKKVNGNDGCNTFMGMIEKATDKELVLSDLATSLMLCENMEQPDLFHAEIQKVKAYRITQKQLVLLDAQGQELLTFEKSTQR